MHWPGRVRWDDLQLQGSYGKWRAYAQSKLANLLFAFELDRRLRRAGSRAISVAAHPGYAATNLVNVGPQMAPARVFERLAAIGSRILAQGAEDGALPTLYAAAAPSVNGGDFVGPGGLFELRGAPKQVRASSRATKRMQRGDLESPREASRSATGFGSAKAVRHPAVRDQHHDNAENATRGCHTTG
jgi:NAD(P)-dependent dehydrogenase (short-subunit alcohol dehydrogenase family)